MDDLIRRHSEVMDRHDPERRVGLYVDEWGTWYDPEPGSNPAFLVQPNTLRDAIVAAVNFNIFQNHADRVRMTNIAQMVNVLQAMIQTDGSRMALTPTYHVFEMYRPFKDATLLPLSVDAPPYSLGGVSIPSVHASAARGADGAIYLALVNLDPNRPARIETEVIGMIPHAVSGRVLTATAMDARNSFDAQPQVSPAPYSGALVTNGRVVAVLPPKAVVVMRVE
jgi:alpha-N-arabinofuranosidase